MSESIRNAARMANFAVTPLFALYNGVLGFWHASLWHGSICTYYLLLSLLRGLLLGSAHKRKHAPQAALNKERRMLRLTSAMLLLMNVALIAPVTLMALDRRPGRLGLIPAIATAAYTTYKITAASVKLKRIGAHLFARQLNRLGFVDALVSILVLQNTLLTAVDGAVTAEMLPLVAVTSAAILLVIFALSVLWLIQGSGKNSEEKFTP